MHNLLSANELMIVMHQRCIAPTCQVFIENLTQPLIIVNSFLYYIYKMSQVQEITPDQLGGIDTNEVASMTLKDGTLIVINGGEEVQAQQEEEFVQEEQPQEEVQAEEVAEEQTQENQLRARPLPGRMVMPVPVPVCM